MDNKKNPKQLDGQLNLKNHDNDAHRTQFKPTINFINRNMTLN